MKKAIIFDMDGVIIDSEKHWQSQEFSLIKNLIPDWNTQDQQKIIGLNLNDIYHLLKTDYQIECDKNNFIDEVEKIAIDIYRHHIQLMPSFMRVIESIHGKMLIGLASSAKREWINIMLSKFELGSYFDCTLSADEIDGPGKPAPDIYLEVATQLKVEPEKCIVIEDSTHGVAAAKSAGMFCIGFRSQLNEKANLSEADRVMEGFGKWDELRLLG